MPQLNWRCSSLIALYTSVVSLDYVNPVSSRPVVGHFVRQASYSVRNRRHNKNYCIMLYDSYHFVKQKGVWVNALSCLARPYLIALQNKPWAFGIHPDREKIGVSDKWLTWMVWSTECWSSYATALNIRAGQRSNVIIFISTFRPGKLCTNDVILWSNL